jgi:hypothetical protein
MTCKKGKGWPYLNNDTFSRNTTTGMHNKDVPRDVIVYISDHPVALCPTPMESGLLALPRTGITTCKKQNKSVPLQAWSVPEGSRKLRFSNFVTTAQDGGKVVSLTHRPPLPPGNTPDTHFC